MIVYVVTNPELGWDCVLGVFKNVDSFNNYYESNYTSWDDLEKDSLCIFTKAVY